MKFECISCGSLEIKTKTKTISVPYRANATETVSLNVEIPVRKCESCGFEFADHEADDARHVAVCRYLGVLTPSEIVSLRKKYGMTRAQFAHTTRIGEASLARWETGEIIQTPANDKYLRLLQFPDNLERVKGKAMSKLPLEVIHQDLKERFRSIKSMPQVEAQARAFAL